MEFGAPKRREVSSNKEKYENISVLTLSAFKAKGTARSLILNNKAIETLGINFETLAADGITKVEPMISFSFDKIKETVTIANTSGLEGVSGVRVAKTSKSASDKAYFEAIKRHYNIPADQEVEILLTENDFEFNGFKTMNLSLLTATEKLETVVAEEAASIIPSEEIASVEESAPAEIEAVNAEAEVVAQVEVVEEVSFEAEEVLPAFDTEVGEIYDGFDV